MKREEIRASGAQEHGVIPQGVAVGQFIFLSAIRGVDANTGEVAPDVEAQIRQAFANLKTLLVAANSDFEHVVKVGVYMKDMHTTRPVLNEIWSDAFGTHGAGPARFSVEVSDLGREGDGSVIQLDVIAISRDEIGS